MKGIVLDFDGVLAHSMELHAEAYRRVLEPYGVRPTNEDVFRREGARSETIIHELLRTVHGPEDADTVRRLSVEKQRIFSRLGPAALYPGARELVRSLRRPDLRLGLVTGTRRENLDHLIPDLLPLFDAVLAQDAYSRDKPHPEPYLRSAQALGLATNRLAALENAERGIRSAKAAGYAYVLGLPTTLAAATLAAAGADAVAGDHAEAARRLLAWASAPTAEPSAPRT